MANTNDNQHYGICPHCGRKYYTLMGSMAHHSKQCDKVADRDR